MKNLNFFAKVALGVVFAACFCSCDSIISISEITENTQFTAFETPSKPTIKGYIITYGIPADEITISVREYDDVTIRMPAGGFYTFYEDSIIVRTANQHKLKILIWDGNE